MINPAWERENRVWPGDVQAKSLTDFPAFPPARTARRRGGAALPGVPGGLEAGKPSRFGRPGGFGGEPGRQLRPFHGLSAYSEDFGDEKGRLGIAKDDLESRKRDLECHEQDLENGGQRTLNAINVTLKTPAKTLKMTKGVLDAANKTLNATK